MRLGNALRGLIVAAGLLVGSALPGVAQETSSPMLELDGRLEPGSVPGAPSTFIPYRFKRVSFPAGPLDPTAVTVSDASFGWSGDGPDGLIVFLSPGTQWGTYTVSVELPDGSHVEARLDHRADAPLARSRSLPTPQAVDSPDLAGPSLGNPVSAALSTRTADEWRVRSDDSTVYDDGVTADNRVAVEEGLRVARAYLTDALGATLTPGLRVDVTSRNAGRPLEGGADARRGLFLNLSTTAPGWGWGGGTTAAGRDFSRRQTVMHEFFHAYQFATAYQVLATRWDASDPDRAVVEPTPVWFVEGGAEWFSWRAAIAGGFIGADEAQACQARMLYGARGVPPLQSMGSMAGFRAAHPRDYPPSLYALTLLMNGRPPTAMRDYLEAIARGDDWRSTWTSAFGDPPEVFYDRANDSLANIPAPPRSPGCGLFTSG